MKIAITSIAFGFICLLAFTNNLGAQIKTVDPKIAGTWKLSFETDHDLWFESPIEIALKTDNQIIAAFSDKTWIKLTNGKINGNEITINGNSQYGEVKIDAICTNDNFIGQWQIGSQKGILKGKRIETVAIQGVSRTEIFDFVQNAIDKQFYDPQFNGVNWNALTKSYRQQAYTSNSDAELIVIIRNMLEELGTSHLEFYRKTPTIPNAVDTHQQTPETEHKSTSSPNPPVIWKTLSSEIGYIQIKRFEEGEDAVALVDQAFKELGNLESLIIDFRGNEGGTLSIGMRLGDYLFSEMRDLGFLCTRSGLDRLKVKSIQHIKASDLPVYSSYDVNGFLEELQKSGIVMLRTGGRASKPYRGKVAVLIDERSGSATEAFAGVIKESGVATLFGQRTAGAMLSSTEIDVPGGWTLLLPEADFVTAGGMRIEGKGIEPHTIVLSKESEDIILESAIKFLNTEKK